MTVRLIIPKSSFPSATKDCRKVFLPAAGNRNGTSVNNAGTNGNYWSSTANGTSNAYNLNFNSSNVNPSDNNNRNYGYSVRLVCALQHSPSL